jgi:hypothetical protein
MKERLGKSSAREILGRAAAIYEATGQKIADRRLPDACHILNESLPWEPKETSGRTVESPRPVSIKTPQEIKEREENFRRQRFGGFRV